MRDCSICEAPASTIVSWPRLGVPRHGRCNLHLLEWYTIVYLTNWLGR